MTLRSDHTLITSRERNWLTFQLATVLTVNACATWCFFIGEYVGDDLGFKARFAAMTNRIRVRGARYPRAVKHKHDRRD